METSGNLWQPVKKRVNRAKPCKTVQNRAKLCKTVQNRAGKQGIL